MRIRLDNEQLLADLLAFMRARGCIAYLTRNDEIEVLRPTRGVAATEEIAELLDRWSANHSEAAPKIVQ